MIILPPRITVNYVKTNKDLTFILGACSYGDGVTDEFQEFKECQNIITVPVKRRSCCAEIAFFRDCDEKDYEELLRQSYIKLETRKKYCKGLVPNPELGLTNWSGPLIKVAPRCYFVLREFLDNVCSPYNIDKSLRVLL